MVNSQAHTTWRTASGLASWIYRPCDPLSGGPNDHSFVSPQQRSLFISRVVEDLPALLGSFARTTSVEISTSSKGEDAVTLRGDVPGALARARDFIHQNSDIMYVCITLTLLCEGLDRQLIEIDHGAALWIDISLGEDGQLDPTTDDPVRLRLQLNTDIYSPLSWGAVRDNTALAALNADRLTGILVRIEQTIPAELMEIDAPDYAGMIGSHGFLGAKSLLGQGRCS